MGALALGVLEAALIGWWQVGIGQPLVAVQYIPILLTWLLLAALVPVVAWFARRLPLFRPPPQRGVRPGAALMHALGAFAFAAAHLGGSALLQTLAEPDLSVAGAVRFQLSFYLALDLLVYGAIVGGYYALRFRREVAERARAEAELRASLTEARLDALRAQLNPHFLFNTLNAISTMSLRGGDPAVSEALGRLGGLLRASLDDASEREIPLRRELELLDDYLAIQEARFPDRLTVERSVDADAAAALVPPFLLQPLVENAVKHGVEARPGGGRVGVRAFRANGRLEIEVTDEGPGPAAERSTEGHGIGLSATRERMRQLYGDDQALELTGRPGGGMAVRVSLPFSAATTEEIR
ncbi:MAG: sensor histidine kinase [Gemmatimonadota bacterium]